MNIEDCIKRIDRYLSSDDMSSRIVNFQNIDDLNKVKKHYDVGNTVFLKVEDYCKTDENLNIADLLNEITRIEGNIFLVGFTTYLKLQGEQKLRLQIFRLLNMTVKAHVIILCYQCDNYLSFSDSRLSRQIYMVEGEKTSYPKLIFVSPELTIPTNMQIIVGVQNIARTIESSDENRFCVMTKKKKSTYPNSLYEINEKNNAFDILCELDSMTVLLNFEYGTEEQWNNALNEIVKFKSWENYITDIFYSCNNLEILIRGWSSFDDEKKWLYFIALKLFNVKNNWCLKVAIQNSKNVNEFIRNIYRSILYVDWNDSDFWDKYTERKNIIRELGDDIDEVQDYCNMVKSKEKYAIYYLTDNTRREKEAIFEWLDRYGEESIREKVEHVLKHIYPDLYSYLLPYRFNNEFLNEYFQMYKYEKVINHIYPEFEDIVMEQAKKREFNRILPSRTEKIELIDKTNTQLYFMDAMGVEYLGFIMEKCRQNGLMLNITVCKSELPSITERNKEFIQEFDEAGVKITSISKIDKIKHEGEENFDYQKTKLPIHLMRELEIIEEVLIDIKQKLMNGSCEKVVMISDHGASRLAVIKENTLNIDVNSKGFHGGRVCWHSDNVNKIPCAIQAGEYYVLASYDRFKGGRAASVETHGGATLEEVTIPIIELTYNMKSIEIILKTKEISFSFRRKAEVELFSNYKLENVRVVVEGKHYFADTEDNNNFRVIMPDIRKAKEYLIDVYSRDNLVASGLKLKVNKEGMKERDIL